MRVTRVLLAVAGCTILACHPTETKKQTVYFGGLTDQTGSLAAPSRFDAIRLAVKHFNEALPKANGFKDFEFSPQLVDSQNDPAVATPRGIQLVMDGGCKAI